MLIKGNGGPFLTYLALCGFTFPFHLFVIQLPGDGEKEEEREREREERKDGGRRNKNETFLYIESSKKKNSLKNLCLCCGSYEIYFF
jgi:hypothetical protein